MSNNHMVSLATEASFAEIQLGSMPLDDLEELHVTIGEIWTRLDPDEDLTIRFRWLMPLVEAELRYRRDRH